MPLPSSSLFWTMATLPSSATELTKSCTALVHTSPSTISNLIATQLPSMLPGATPTSSSPPNSHTFTSQLVVGKSSSGKRILEPFHFSLHLAVDSSFTEITITTPITPDAPEPQVPISGTILLTEADFGTTTVTLTVTTDRDSNIVQPSTPPSAEPAPPKKLTTVERVAAADKERDIARAKAGIVMEALDDAPSNWITPADAHTTDSSATGTKSWEKIGTKKNTVRNPLSTMKNMTAKMLSTKKTWHSKTIHIPAATVTKILDHLLNLIPALHKMYSRYDEVDAAMYAHFESTISNTSPIQSHESDLMDASLKYDDQNYDNQDVKICEVQTASRELLGTAWKRIPNSITSPTSYFQKIDSDSSAWGKAVATVDASHTHVFSYLWNQHSHERMHRHVEKEGPDALNKIVFVPNSHSMLRALVVNFGLAFSKRVFLTWLVWRQEPDKSFTLAFAPLSDSKRFNSATVEIYNALNDDAAAAGAIRGTVKGFWRIVPLSPEVCQVTFLVQEQVGGSLPRALLNTRITSTLSQVHTMQDKFERKGKVVDAEMRSASPLPPPLAELNDEQKLVVESCRYLESEEGSELKPLPSSSPFVDMWYKHAPARRGELSIALGKATAVIDCSARDALAYFFAIGSRERLRISSEQGNPARLVQRRTGANDMVFAMIKKMKFPLHNRELVNRQICCSDVNGDFILILVPINEVIDYGMKTNTVRGVSRAIMRLTPEGHGRCKATYHLYLDAGGRIPTFVMNAKLPLALGTLGDLREEFQRDDEIDILERDELAATMRDLPQTFTAEEDILVNKVNVKLGMLEWEDFEELESPDRLVEMGKIFIEDSDNIVGSATTVVDASVEQCAAWDFTLDSRARQRAFRESKRGEKRQLERLNGHAVINYTAYRLGSGLTNREGYTKSVWKRIDPNTVEIGYAPCERTEAFYSEDMGWVTARYSAHLKFQRLASVHSVNQTKVTMRVHTDVGGQIPVSFVNRSGVSQLMHLSRMRIQFDKSLEVDDATRLLNVEMILGHYGVEYSEEENRVLAEGERHFADFQEMKVKSLPMASPLTTAKIAFKSGDKHAWGWSTTTVRARPEEVLAFLWDTMRRSAQREDDLEKSVEELINGHNMLVYNKKRTPKIIADRDFLGRVVWKKKGDGFFYVTSPEESATRPITDGVVRGKYPSAIRIKRKNDKETTLEYTVQIDFGGSLPTWLTNSYVSSSAARVTEIQEYFQALRGMEEFDADDARAVGEVMCIKTKAEKHHEKGENKQSACMRELFKKHLSLSEIGRRYEFFEGMMARVVRSTLMPAGDVNSKLCSVSLKEGETIGRGLAMSLASSLTVEAGVDEWILKHRSLGELDWTETWFRPMLNVVAKRLLGEVSWGLKMRVTMGAGLSILDMATDIFVIVGYMGKEETRGYGRGLLGMIVASMVLQLFIVFCQNKGKARVLMKESLIVLTGLKPGVDCYRLCAGQEMEEHHIFDAKYELVLTKFAEIIAESIPGCLLQVYVMLKVGNVSGATVGSLLVSAITTGFSSASISFDFDVDPSKRKETPDFYGYIPDGGSRTVIFGCMILNSALLLLIRSLGAAMLMLAKKRYFVMYMGGDMALYLLQKVARGDFHYSIPIYGAVGLFVSLIIRVLVKTITDFTGVIQMRHPGELGGLYWTANTCLALLASFVCVWVGDGERMHWTLMGAAGGLWMLTFVLFLLLAKKGHRKTFFSTATGKQYLMDRFKVNDDAIKASVLKKNKKMWRGIRGEVKTWVLNNWWRWQEEKPKWMTDSWLAKLPDDFVPDDEVLSSRLEVIRKKGSAMEALNAARISPTN